MTKESLPLPVADLSGFARALARQFPADAPAPSHLSLMNMLARAAGFRNLQHLRAARKAEARSAEPKAPPVAVDHALISRALNLFDDEGRLRQWPARRSVQVLSLWALWARLPAGQVMTERQISAALNALHHFGDAAILRRDMVALGLLRRKNDASDYARIEQAPPPEARALIGQLSSRKTLQGPDRQ